ncbi:MAG: Mov34/MPN/PAD-1 family protein [Methanoculleaceae archaeon]
MHIRGISRSLIDDLLAIGAGTTDETGIPVEFAGLLLEDGGIIDRIFLLPGTISRPGSASLFLDMMPLDTHVAGSAHSHPNGALRPSAMDLRFFARTGRYHIIVGPPYAGESWRCFHPDGSPAELEVIG